MSETAEPSGAPSDRADDDALLESLPKEVGVLLIVAGIGGLLLPGPIGTPFLVIGGVVLFPRTFRKVDQSMKKRFPKFYLQGVRQVHRFVVDLERRYPTPRLD
jgi:hypothetical protein